MDCKPIEINALRLMGIKTELFPQGIPATFEKLQQVLSTFDGRKVYGVTWCTGNELNYWAGVEEKLPGEAAQYALETIYIPGGKYLLHTLHNWREQLAQVSTLFDEMLKQPNVLKQSICLEYYRTNTEADLMVQLT
jgi:predicted transcriptional regulator YdeE